MAKSYTKTGKGELSENETVSKVFSKNEIDENITRLENLISEFNNELQTWKERKNQLKGLS